MSQTVYILGSPDDPPVPDWRGVKYHSDPKCFVISHHRRWGWGGEFRWLEVPAAAVPESAKGLCAFYERRDKRS